MAVTTLTCSLILLTIIFIIFSLGTALYFLVKNQNNDKKMVNALSVRIILSLVLFFALFFGFSQGLISPHGLQPIDKHK
ncbi:MAG: twin transrane helix small protein [Francisellaceae bacterium]|nr:twin transrane helix small protein [Francisellaceae bacterium]